MAAPKTWEELCERLQSQFGIEVDLNGVLFLIGIRERGLMFQNFTKEEKWSLINLGSCTLLKEMGLIDETGIDGDGWPIYREKSVAPKISNERRQKILQDCAIRYFEKVY